MLEKNIFSCHDAEMCTSCIHLPGNMLTRSDVTIIVEILRF